MQFQTFFVWNASRDCPDARYMVRYLGLNINIQSRSGMLRWNLGNPTKPRSTKIGVSALPTLYANGDLNMSDCAVGLFWNHFGNSIATTATVSISNATTTIHCEISMKRVVQLCFIFCMKNWHAWHVWLRERRQRRLKRLRAEKAAASRHFVW